MAERRLTQSVAGNWSIQVVRCSSTRPAADTAAGLLSVGRSTDLTRVKLEAGQVRAIHPAMVSLVACQEWGSLRACSGSWAARNVPQSRIGQWPVAHASTAWS